MEIVEFDTAIRWLFLGFGLAVMWLAIGLAVQIFATLRGSTRESGLVPRWLRPAVVAVISSVAIPKAAQAEGNTTAGVSDSHGDRDGDLSDIALVGSVVANGAFLAFHVRRRLALIRTRKFTRSEKTYDASFEGKSCEPAPGPDWVVLVQVLGPPIVTTSDGDRVCFERGKALELLVWMAEHRHASTRSAARTALWDGLVKDSTFSNVVSDVRRSLSSCHTNHEEDWIPRTFTDELPLHAGVVTDAELLGIATENFERDSDTYAAGLARCLSGVRNLPFSGADYAWADGEGITTSHVIKVVRAAVLLAEYAIETDDENLLFAATERGLRVLPGHEQLVSLRMRGHARSGNRSAIKFEWESYARAIEADSWAGATPSSELENLARELSKA